MRPIFAIARTTVGEAIRRKVLLIILLIGLVVLIIAPGLGVLSTRSSDTVLRSMMLGIIQLTSAVIAIVLTVYMIPNEIERRTIYTILSKPVHRWQVPRSDRCSRTHDGTDDDRHGHFLLLPTAELARGNLASSAADLVLCADVPAHRSGDFLFDLRSPVGQFLPYRGNVCFGDHV